MPPPSRAELARLSRDRNALLRGALLLTAVSFLLAFLFSLLPAGIRGAAPEFVSKAPSTVPGLIDFARFTPFPGGRSCFDLAKSMPRPLLAEMVEASLEDLAGNPEAEPLRIWWRGLLSDSRDGAVSALESLPEDTARRDEFLGDLLYLSGDTEAALHRYLAAAARSPGSGYAERSALSLARFEEDRDLVRSLLADPSHARAFSPAERMAGHAAIRDYAGLALATFHSQAESLASIEILPSLFTAAIWFLILLSFREPGHAATGTAVIAFGAGIASAFLTVYAATVQEELRGFRAGPSDPEMRQFLYLLAGVSLREESLKLLAFLPLAIALRKRGTPLEALLLAGFVGLGFAFQENLAYFRGGTGTFTAWVRLLTANALHFSLTGVAGHALWRLLARRGQGWEDFLLTFLAVILAHAVYNAVLSIPSLAEYAVLHPILVAVIAYRYFDPLRRHMEIAGLHRRLSPLGIFVIGSALLTGTILVTSALVMPFRFAAGAFAASVGAMLPLAFAFISRFRDL